LGTANDALQEIAGGIKRFVSEDFEISAQNFAEFQNLLLSLPKEFSQDKTFDFEVAGELHDDISVLNTLNPFYIEPPYDDENKQANGLFRLFNSKIMNRQEITYEELKVIIEEISEETKSSVAVLLQDLTEFSCWDKHPLRNLHIEKDGEKIPFTEVLGELYAANITPTTIYTYKAEDLYEDDVCFNAVSINVANIQQFRSFDKLPIKHSGGSVAFGVSLDYHGNPNTTVFAVFASNKKYTAEPRDIGAHEVEMYSTATTSENSYFSSHMGIQKTCVAGAPHKGLSIHLHKFAAGVIQAYNPQVEWMITTPVGIMRTIMSKALDKIGERIIVDMTEEKLDTIIQGELGQVDRSYKGWEKDYKHLIVQRCLLGELVIAQDKLIQSGDVTIPIEHFAGGQNKGTARMVDAILHLHDCQEIKISPEEQREEFAWFFWHSYQKPALGACTTIVDNIVLAKMGSEPFPLEHTVLGADAMHIPDASGSIGD
jgi:hypothetical protein